MLIMSVLQHLFSCFSVPMKDILERTEDKDGFLPVHYLNRDTPSSVIKLLDFPTKKFDEVMLFCFFAARYAILYFTLIVYFRVEFMSHDTLEV